MRRVWNTIKILATLAAVTAFGIATFIFYELWSMQRKIDAANATALLVNNRIVNLNTQFGSEDICILPAEAFVVEWASRIRPGYRPKESIDPDSSLYWAILVFDTKNKSYRYYIINRRAVELGDERSFCSDKLILKVESNDDPKVDSKWLATVIR